MAKDQFYELFLNELKDIHNAQKQQLNLLPKLIEKVSDHRLKDVLQNHFLETQQQINRLKQAFENLNENPDGVVCAAMEGLIKEAEGLLNKYTVSAIQDAAIITIAQRIRHYEMAVYGTLRTYAKHLDYDEIADLLQESLNERGRDNKKLTEIAEGGFFTSGINQKALSN